MFILLIIFAHEIEGMTQNPTYKSKNGLDIVIRHANAKDAESLLNLKLDYLKDTKTIPLFQDEYTKTIEQEGALITKLNEQKNSCLFVAEYNGKLIGNVDIHGNQRRKLVHTALLGIGLSEDWQGLGIGTMLLNKAVNWAKSNHFLEIIILDVYDSNEPGKALYEKTGFEISGRIKGFFKEDGKSIDNLRMVYLCK